VTDTLLIDPEDVEPTVELNRAPAPTETDLRLAQDLRMETNLVRLSRGLPLFKYDQKLQDFAQSVIHRQIDEGWYGHIDLQGNKVGGRLLAAGFPMLYCQENIAFGHPNAPWLIEGFMASSAHRHNILNPGFVYLGIGTAVISELAQFQNTRENRTQNMKGRIWNQIFYTPKATA
jgi:uncharacterized protein YkwD